MLVLNRIYTGIKSTNQRGGNNDEMRRLYHWGYYGERAAISKYFMNDILNIFKRFYIRRSTSVIKSYWIFGREFRVSLPYYFVRFICRFRIEKLSSYILFSTNIHPSVNSIPPQPTRYYLRAGGSERSCVALAKCRMINILFSLGKSICLTCTCTLNGGIWKAMLDKYTIFYPSINSNICWY